MTQPQASRHGAPAPGDVAALLAPRQDELVRHIRCEVLAVAPEYAFDGSEIDGVITAAVRYATGLTAGDGQRAGRDTRRMSALDRYGRLFRGLGRREYLLGRSLERLHAAYCAGGRAAWQFLIPLFGESAGPDSGSPDSGSTAPGGGQVGRGELCRVADAVFATVEHLSALSTEGFAAARDETVDDRERARARLLALILSDPPPTGQAIRTLAEQAGWAVPDRVMAVAVDARHDADRVPLLLDPDILRDLRAGSPCLLAPARPGHRDELGRQLRGRRAAVGPPVPVTEAARSLAIARRAAELRQAGTLPDEDVLHCTDHLAALVLLADPPLLGELIAHSLAELRTVGPQQRNRLAETLLSWLRRQGNTAEIAEELGVHPQTVRYRMGQLRELFGARLDDSAARTAMLLALSGGRLLAGASDGARADAGDPEL